MRTLIIDGNLGKDAEIHESKVNKTKFLTFSIANRYFDGKEQKTEWFDIRVFNPLIVEKRADFLKKGRYVIVSGTLSSSLGQAANGGIYLNQSILADNIEFPSVGGGRDKSNASEETVSTGVVKETVSEPAPVAPVQEVPEYVGAISLDTNLEGDDLPF